DDDHRRGTCSSGQHRAVDAEPRLSSRGVGGGPRTGTGQTVEYVVSTVEREGRRRGHASPRRPNRMKRVSTFALILIALAALPAYAQGKKDKDRRGFVWDDRPTIVFG